MAELTDRELLQSLGVEIETKQKPKRTSREERIIAGFEDIQRFVEEHGHVPVQGEDKDIFERIYAVRLEQIRILPEANDLLREFDYQNLLDGQATEKRVSSQPLTDAEILADLGIEPSEKDDITTLKHVRPRAEIKAAEEIARRQKCEDFERFEPLFKVVQKELDSGVRTTSRFQNNADISLGEFFILGGQKVFVAEFGTEFVTEYDRRDRRLRVIYDNGTESDLLLRSLQRALYKDEAGRRISDKAQGRLFSSEESEDDVMSGRIYILRSLSENPEIKKLENVLHKIGVTGGSIEKRITDALNDPSFLMAKVEIVESFKLSNVDRTKMEGLLHRFFSQARLNVEIMDRFGKPTRPQEWFLVPAETIIQAINRILDGTIADFEYCLETASLVRKKL